MRERDLTVIDRRMLKVLALMISYDDEGKYAFVHNPTTCKQLERMGLARSRLPYATYTTVNGTISRRKWWTPTEEGRKRCQELMCK